MEAISIIPPSRTMGRNQHTPPVDAETLRRRRKLRARIACDLLLAGLFKNHPDHAALALSGVQPNVVDLEPPPIPERIEKPSAEIVPLPTPECLSGRHPPMPIIIEMVAEFYNVSVLDICSQRRTAQVVLPRQIVMYLGRALTLNSHATVGRMLGGRDHTTALHAARKIEKQIQTDARLADEIEILKQHIAQKVLKQTAA